MIKLFDHSSNEGLAILSQVLGKGEHVLGNLWTDQLTQQAALNLRTLHTVLPGIDAQFRAAQPTERAQFPTTVDPQLLEGTTVNFSRSLVRLAWMLQHVVTILPWQATFKQYWTPRQQESVTSMHGGLCCHLALEWAPSRITRWSRSDTRISADTSTVPGNWEALPQVDSRTNPQVSNSYYGTPMPESTVWSR